MYNELSGKDLLAAAAQAAAAHPFCELVFEDVWEENFSPASSKTIARVADSGDIAEISVSVRPGADGYRIELEDYLPTRYEMIAEAYGFEA